MTPTTHLRPPYLHHSSAHLPQNQRLLMTATSSWLRITATAAIGLVLIALASLTVSPALAADPPAASELLAKYTQALDSLRSIIVKAQIAHQYEYAFARNWPEEGHHGLRDKGVRYESTELRTDGSRFHWRAYCWGQISPMRPVVPQTGADYNCLNYADGLLYQNTSGVSPETHGLVYVHLVPEFRLRDLETVFHGRNVDTDDRVDRMLQRARSISVRPALEKIRGSECYALDAVTDAGKFSVWLDPSHGYHLARLQVQAGQGDLYWGKPLGQAASLSNRVEILRFEKTSGLWVPMEADVSRTNQLGPGTFTRQQSHYRRTHVVLHPDHEALGSFKNPFEHPQNDPLFKNGTLVYLRDDPVCYVWNDGRLTPDPIHNRALQYQRSRRISPR